MTQQGGANLFLLAVSLLIGTVIQAAAQTPAATCQAVVTVSNAWVSDGTNNSYVSVNLNIVNTSPQILSVPWTLTLKSLVYGNIKQVKLPADVSLKTFILSISHAHGLHT
jgi:hypothetical protein